jgi:hypothetical protein
MDGPLKQKNVSFVSLTEKIDTSTPVGIAVFSILAAISQLELDLISERVKNGLANARSKGKLVGRKKMRDSDLIRKLLRAGVTYLKIAGIAKCSHGSVSAERAAMKREELAGAPARTEPETIFPEISASVNFRRVLLIKMVKFINQRNGSGTLHKRFKTLIPGMQISLFYRIGKLITGGALPQDPLITLGGTGLVPVGFGVLRVGAGVLGLNEHSAVPFP